MGQYYKVVNLDKRQTLNPNIFNDGLKLLEFGCSANGTMCALAVLTASGNGRGGGDLAITHESKTKPLPSMREDQRVEWQSEHKDLNGDKTCIAGIVPTIVGSWAGDRIVVAGDYDDPGKFLTRELVREWCVSKGWASTAVENGHKVRDWYMEGNKKVFRKEDTDFSDPNRRPNLYHIAEDLFEDVSERVLMAMCDDPYIRESVVKSFAYYDRNPPSFLRKAIKKAKKAHVAFIEKFNQLTQPVYNQEQFRNRQDLFIREAKNFTDDEMRELLEHHPFDSVDIIRRLLDKKTFDQRQTVASLEGVNWGLLQNQKLMLVRLYQNRNALKHLSATTVDEALSGIVHLLDNIQDQAAEQLGEKAVFGDLVITP